MAGVEVARRVLEIWVVMVYDDATSQAPRKRCAQDVEAVSKKANCEIDSGNVSNCAAGSWRAKILVLERVRLEGGGIWRGGGRGLLFTRW